jgi:hypothetical protein
MARKNLPSHPSRHPLYVPGLLSTNQISSLDWSKIINTPTTVAGYGITDVYTDTEVDALIADFLTEAAADALFLTPAEGDAAYAALSHTHAWSDITGEPTTLAGYGITDAYTDAQVDTLLAALSLPDLDDVTLTAPADGDLLTYDLASGQWVNTAASGGGPHTLDSHTDVDTTGVSTGDVLTYDGADWIAQAPAAAGVDGTGVALRHAVWSDSDTLTASVVLENNDPGIEEGIILVPDAGRATIVMQADNVTPGQSATNPGWTIRADTDAGGGVFEIIENWGGDTVMEILPGGSLDFPLVGIDFTTGTVRIDAQGGADEGGEVQMLGAGVNIDWTLDNFQGRTRLFSGSTEHFNWQRGSFNLGFDAGTDDAHISIGSAGAGGSTNLAIGYVGVADNYQIRYNDDMEGNQIDAAKPSWALPIGEGASDTFSIYRRPAGGAYVLLWKATNAGHWQPGISATVDIGGPSNRVRTVYAQQLSDGTGGELVTSAGAVAMYGSGSSWTQLNFYISGTARWHMTSAGHWWPVADNTYDIGSSALAVRSIYVDTSILVGGTKVIGAQGASIANASSTTASNTTTINLILARLRASTGHGLIAG